MNLFKVTEVIDGDTFKVEKWSWNNRTGDTVRPTGYDIPEKGTYGYQSAKDVLTKLILGKDVDIRKVATIDKYGRLVADVYYNEKNLADYFPEYKR
jgi:endonuclease YncB( thermonuclease family)